MSRWFILLIAGVTALPSGCVALSQIEMPCNPTPWLDQPEPTAASFFGPRRQPHALPASLDQPEPAAGAELPPAQAASVCLTTAATLEKEGHEPEAILEYQRARQLDPRLPGVAWRLAVLYGKQGDPEHARTEFQLALQERPQDADLLNDFGYFYYQLGENAAAEQALRQALALNPQQQRAWVNLGKVLTQGGHYSESCEAFGHVVRPAQAAANVGILLVKEGKIQEAREVLHKALNLEPDLNAARLVLTQLESTTPPDVRLTVE